MEHSIGVGMIVGLVFATSTYIWNSDSFTKSQKSLLLVLIIFPPAQWVGILIILIFNNYKVNNSTEKITERKVEQIKSSLENSISNLSDLKSKGILTEEEYNSKVEKIETEKAEQNLKNSLEYKQLKSLFDNGILTKEEFEEKVKLIDKTPIKQVSIEESERLKEYVQTIKTPIKAETKTEKPNNNFVYIVTASIVLILIILIIINSNNNYENQTYASPPSTSLDTLAVANENDFNSNFQEPVKIKKFVYLVFKINIPKLDALEIIGNSFDNYKVIDYYYSTKWEEAVFTSDVIEIEDYNEDNKNRLLDEFETKMVSKLEMYDYNYTYDVKLNCKDDSKKEGLLIEKAKITKRDVYDFNTYADASLSKRNMQ